MAINSAAKRASCTGVGRPWMRAHYAGTINEQWRVGAGNAYNGNELSGQGGPPSMPPGLAKKMPNPVVNPIVRSMLS